MQRTILHASGPMSSRRQGLPMVAPDGRRLTRRCGGPVIMQIGPTHRPARPGRVWHGPIDAWQEDPLTMCDVLVIGPEPPRPRCDLVLALVGQAAQAFGAVAVRHCAFDSPEAIELGRRLGCRVCTAKQVAAEAGLAVDWVSVHDLIDPKMSSLPPHGRPSHAWSAELDRILEPCQRAAQWSGTS